MGTRSKHGPKIKPKPVTQSAILACGVIMFLILQGVINSLIH